MLQLAQFTFNPFMENTYVVYLPQGEAWIIDPGCSTRAEEKTLEDFIRKNELNVTRLINTHCHIDHVLGNYFVKNKFHVPLYLHTLEEAVLRSVKLYAPMYGFAAYQETEPDGYLSEEDVLELEHHQLKIIFVPGHSPGHIALYYEQGGWLLGGDVLFDGSIGRTDLPGGDFDTLIKSIHEKLFVLPDPTVVHCGHGPSTTIGKEKRTNPFCALTT
ncbi:MAG: MBL fold metallo-hydrolase [Cyclobacteriaceae bacterium]|nr:MBL fold metallo-hydrolase [Cyclobacteriaceae bacterium]